MIKPIAAATAAALLALGATACSNGPLATQSSSAGSSGTPANQECAGLSGTARQDCLNGGPASPTIGGNNATGGAGGSANAAPGTAGTSGGASGGNSSAAPGAAGAAAAGGPAAGAAGAAAGGGGG